MSVYVYVYESIYIQIRKELELMYMTVYVYVYGCMYIDVGTELQANIMSSAYTQIQEDACVYECIQMYTHMNIHCMHGYTHYVSI